MQIKGLHRLIILAVISLLTACAGNKATQAPVVDGWKQNPTAAGDYRVQPGDSLYSIAWGFGVDYHDLARYNQLSEPYALQTGQILHMSPPPVPAPQPQPISTVAVEQPAPVAVAATAAAPVKASSANNVSVASSAASKPKPITQSAQTSTPVPAVKPEVKAVVAPQATGKWVWPTKGRVVRGYSTAASGNHGLDIAGQLEQPVVASAAGKVVYAGSGMPGYGNLIIIKHNENDLSAYAFNKKLEVKEGDAVKAGQCIAFMGKNDAGQTLLHFEIRRDGKPVNPMGYLK